jgi:hypothetical protein
VEAPPSKKVKEDVADVNMSHHNISNHHPESNVQQSIEVVNIDLLRVSPVERHHWKDKSTLVFKNLCLHPKNTLPLTTKRRLQKNTLHLNGRTARLEASR